MTKFNLKSIAIGFAAGLAVAVAAAAAQAGQSVAQQPPAEHAHGQAQDAAPQHGQDQATQHGGMMDPAMRQQMMERMRQCHETMSTIMRHIEEMDSRDGEANRQP